MSKFKQKPAAKIKYDLAPRALAQWNPAIRAAAEDDNTISVFDVIGEDFWGEGVTTKRIAAALRSIGKGDVVVNINSPGGDMFEGLAIYSLLREHPGNVTVRVLGLAASAASVIAMAGDEIQIARAGFLMIHNAWTYASGNRHDFREIADYMEPFDKSMASIYESRPISEDEDIPSLMDAETWIGGSDAVDRGFADALLASDQVTEDEDNPSAHVATKLDVALAKAGMPRTERRRLLKEFKSSTQNAAGGGKPNAAATDTLRAIELNLEPLPKLTFPM